MCRLNGYPALRDDTNAFILIVNSERIMDLNGARHLTYRTDSAEVKNTRDDPGRQPVLCRDELCRLPFAWRWRHGAYADG